MSVRAVRVCKDHEMGVLLRGPQETECHNAAALAAAAAAARKQDRGEADTEDQKTAGFYV